ncbi:MAG: dihydroorotase, partial [Clostridia bacterium]|nr:dihydroorotase [Clostridia bacterium]
MGDSSFQTEVPFSLSDALTDASSLYIFPGFCDVHVHFREPGFSYKETVRTGSMAAAHGGYTTVCTMPNLSPAPDTVAHLALQRELIEKDAVVDVHPFGTITMGEEGRALSDMEAIAPFVCGYTDDGKGVDDIGLMREAMSRAKALGKVIAAHCEDGTQVKDSPEAEWKEVERDIALAAETGVKLHICHVSTKESVALIRDGKKNGIDVTCETGPHYLLLTDGMKEDSGRFRMNPPLREEADRLALVEGLLDGTVDMIATDHAPHSAEEKARGWAKSLNGIVGLETAFPVLYTDLVKTGVLPLEKLVHLMSVAPYERFGLACRGFCVYDLNAEYEVKAEDFLSMGKSSPFTGRRVTGQCVATVMDGKAIYLG